MKCLPLFIFMLFGLPLTLFSQNEDSAEVQERDNAVYLELGGVSTFLFRELCISDTGFKISRI